MLAAAHHAGLLGSARAPIPLVCIALSLAEIRAVCVLAHAYHKLPRTPQIQRLRSLKALFHRSISASIVMFNYQNM